MIQLDRAVIAARKVATLLAALVVGACAGGATDQPAPHQAAEPAPRNLTGVWATSIRYMEEGAPVVLRDTHWAPLSAGRPEDIKAPSYEQQAAAFRQLLKDDVDVFKWAAEHAFHPRLTKAGEAVASAALAAAKVPRSPIAQCLPRNTVGFGYGGAMQIAQLEDRLLLVTEGGITRTIYLDGRGHGASQPSWFGHSVGRWNGQTLEVDTSNFSGRMTVLDAPVPSGTAMKVIESFAVSADGNVLSIKIVYEDPEMLVEPVARMVYLDRQPANYELLYNSCLDNLVGAEEYAATISKQ
jgi:hypothetical protein